MSYTAPIPSKNALRALRNIALGTSCTVAFGAGLLTTEDRRKRIKLATQIRDNAREIKSIKSYHAAATAVSDKVDDYGGILQLRPASDNSHGLRQPGSGQQQLNSPRPKSRAKRKAHLQELRTPHEQVVWVAPVWSTPAQRETYPTEQLAVTSPDARSNRLAFDVVRLIGDGTDAARIDAATLRLLEAFKEDSPTLKPRLKDAAAQLAVACGQHSKYSSMQKVLEGTLRRGRLTRREFERFRPEQVIAWLLEPDLAISDDVNKSPENRLKEAASIFLIQLEDSEFEDTELEDTDCEETQFDETKFDETKFDETKFDETKFDETKFDETKFDETKFDERDTQHTSTQLHAVGQRLCEKTCAQKLFQLTEKVYWRLSSTRGVTSDSVHQLIVAAYGLKKYTDVVRYFRKFYQYAGDQSELIRVVEMALDCTAHNADIHLAEVVYKRAAMLAKRAGLMVPSSWLLKVLGSHWRSKKDIAETRKLFDHLEQYICYTRVPEAAYAAIIQFCIEADQEATAEVYLATFQDTYSTRGLGVRICGHFALAKAKRGDWTGVHDALRKITKTRAPTAKQKADYSAVFMPIFKLYAETHSLSETESFFRIFVGQYGMPITYYMSTYMVDLYGRHKELGALVRWVRYILSISPRLVDAEVFNIMLKNCRKQWRFSFQQLLQLLWAVKKLGGVRALGLTNDATFDVLMRVAIRDAKGNPDKLARSVSYELFHRARPYLSDNKSLQLTMAEAIARGRSPLALKILDRAESKKGFVLDSEILITAVKASVHVYGHDLGPTLGWLRRTQDKKTLELALGQILYQQLVREEHERWGLNPTHDNLVLDKIHQTIQKLQDTGYEIPDAVVRKVADVLNQSGAYRHALDFWKAQVDMRPALMIDNSGLDICFNAYMGLKDGQGLLWVSSMLLKYDVVPENYWYRKLKTVIWEAHDAPNLQDFFNAACSTIEVVQAQRHRGATGRKDASVSTFQVMQEAISEHRRRRRFAQLPPKKPNFEAGIEGMNLNPVSHMKKILSRPVIENQVLWHACT